jgi:LmbE family N-acetylglucosaminyl deacetylase
VIGLAFGAPDAVSVLAIGAHADDIEIGAAGLILELLASTRLRDITWLVLSAEGAREVEARTSAQRLVGDAARLDLHIEQFRERYFPHDPAIKERFDALGANLRPDVVLAPRLEDQHQDHRTAAELAWQTFRSALILEYEIPKYEGDLGHPNVYVPLSAAAVDRKVSHIMSAFPSQRPRAWFTEETFRGLARLRGIEAGGSAQFAEGFTCRKLVLQQSAR